MRQAIVDAQPVKFGVDGIVTFHFGANERLLLGRVDHIKSSPSRASATAMRAQLRF